MPSFVLSIAAFAVFLVVTVVIYRAVQVRKTMHALAAVFVAVFVAAVAFAAAFLRDIDFWAFASGYLCLFLIFVQVFSIFYKSISLRLVLDLEARDGGRAPLDQVYDDSIIAGSYHRRLAVLEEGGLIARRGDTIELTPKGAVMARRLVLVQGMLGIDNSG